MSEKTGTLPSTVKDEKPSAREGLPRVLCVDDEPRVLEGLMLQLRKQFAVFTATSGPAGLECLATDEFAVVISDMRMPEMDGAVFLAHARRQYPDAVRILLTGNSDLDAAIAAVNEGEIFRFLSKPCPPDTLLKAVGMAAEQHRLVTAERVLLHQTLRGSINVLTDILALDSPAAFGRAMRAKRVVMELAEHMGAPDRWAIELAAMLSQLGYVTLPQTTIQKVHEGKPLNGEELVMISRLPGVTDELLSNIPRLEPVREILRHVNRRFDGIGVRDASIGEATPLGSRMLKVVLDFDLLEGQGYDVEPALETLRGRARAYDPEVLEAFASMKATQASEKKEIREVPLTMLHTGMTFADDVRTASGSLLIARGQEATEGVLERLRNFSGSVKIQEPIRVIVHAPHAKE